jgi:hypothetical protein
MNNITDTITSILTFLLIVAVAALILGFPLMLLWNWLMPIIFNLPQISFLEALGLNALATILFKNSTTTTKKD